MKESQSHPSHFHKEKEETFHILTGKIIINVNEKAHFLEAGDIITIERFHKHSFYALTNVIFEEISTTHIYGDSFYDDSEIIMLDPMEKKTKVEKL